MRESKLVVATVDDDRRVLQSLQSVLESAGYEAVTRLRRGVSMSGALALVTVIGMCFPGMNGTELQQRIRQHGLNCGHLRHCP